MSQHSKVRLSPTCIACGGLKNARLLVCWPCNREQKYVHGGRYDPCLEELFDLIEDDSIGVLAAHSLYARGDVLDSVERGRCERT
jgi:hypothetical protein